MQNLHKLIAGAVLGAAIITAPAVAAAQDTIRIGQSTSALSFLPIWTARALDTFKDEGLKAEVTITPGGDPSALAALDAGDVDLAAVGSEAALRAIAKGQPFQIIFSLMSKVTLQLVVSPAVIKRTGVKTSDPIEKRLAAIKGALIGVSSIGGAQDAAARWLAFKAGLNPKTDISVAQIGSPPALRAALENQRIEGFVLSPPEGYIAEKSGAGTTLVSLGDEFKIFAHQPYLVFVAKKPVDAKTSTLIVKTLRAMQSAALAVRQKPDVVGNAIQSKFFKKASADALVFAVKSMSPGVADGGRLDAESFQNLLTYAKDVGTSFGKDFDAKSSENDVWTNSFIDKAKAK
jgi:ABC-type nitrate/sulfonate/bicarbonate transport system substrate-binding protein